jgi:hypothetical protein
VPSECKALLTTTLDKAVQDADADVKDNKRLYAMAHLYRGLTRGCAQESRSDVEKDLEAARVSQDEVFGGSATCHPQRMMVWGYERFLAKQVPLDCTPNA